MGFSQEQVRNARLCKTCGKEKPLDAFYRDKNGYRAHCRPCHLAKKKAWYDANRDDINARRQAWAKARPIEERRDQDLRHRFGIGVAEVEAMLARQNGCAVCHITELDTKRWWHVDHDHACCPENGRSCGKCVRGILCHRCNLLLGQARDSVSILCSAIEYLGG